MITMSPEAKAASAAYMREWRKKHPEKQREYNIRKWERKAQQLAVEREAANAQNEDAHN